MRQIDDLRDIPEVEAQLDNALGEVNDIKKCMEGCAFAIKHENPFKLMVELADAQSKIEQAMSFAIAAQRARIKTIKAEAMRIA